MTDKQAAALTAAELRDAFVARHFQADTSCCSDGEPVSGKLVHIGMFGDFPCRAGREREREASDTADLDALLAAARAEAIAEHGAAAFQAARSEAWDQAAESRANEIAAARTEALRLAMDECEAEAALCDSEKSGLDAGSAARNCRDRIEFTLVKP